MNKDIRCVGLDVDSKRIVVAVVEPEGDPADPTQRLQAGEGARLLP
jgi:hypothetical protein